MNYLHRSDGQAKPIIGVLLYAGTTKFTKLKFKRGSEVIVIQALDLQAEWKEIRKVLTSMLRMSY
jgi:hypothetical protein